MEGEGGENVHPRKNLQGMGWMKLSVTRARLMHYTEGRIARFSLPLIDRLRIYYLKMYVGGLVYRMSEENAFSRIETAKLE